jgi:hypothetical protein
MRTRLIWLAMIAMFLVPAFAAGQQPASFSQRTASLDRRDGYIPMYWDAARGRLLLEISRFNEDVLYFVTTSKGIGSVELGVDRGLTANSAAIRFERIGPRVHVVQQNLRFRAPNGNAALQQGMEESFASSVLAALPIEAEEGERVLVDATPLVIRDADDIEGQLRRRNQGAFRLDAARSTINLARTKGFPRNTEIDTTLTFASDNPGPVITRVVPEPRALTVRYRHSLVQPPDPGYRPRAADPRIGVGSIAFKDYSAPFSRGTEVRWIRRWRLEKKDPNAPMSEPRQPIVFYLDPGIPEPIRSGMREGTLWWNEAFEAAGFRNAVQVADPGPEIDPMDIRYSYILWVNRDERGFSNGGSFSDPRTGEMLVAKPRMDSHRIRTISNYWDAYRPTTDGDGDDCGGLTPADEIAFMQALRQSSGQARQSRGYSKPANEEQLVVLRQALVTAHEVGHTLGFGHNWLSSINDRASVMEYPTPRLKVVNGRIDVSEAYQNAIGEYDKYMARYSYTPFPPDREAAGLDGIVREMRTKRILYAPSSDPRWSRYDDLASPSDYLRETMAARKIILERYGPDILGPGEPIGDLRDARLWMTYLHHRWAIDTGVRYVGGEYDNLAVKGEEIPPTEIVPPALQREVLALLMETIQPANLAFPDRLLAQLGSSPFGPNLEEFNSATGPVFDHLSAARTVSAMVLEQLLEPQRAARLVAFADREPAAPTLIDVLDVVIKGTWGATGDTTPMHRSLRRVAQREALDAMMILAAHRDATPEVRALTLDRIARVGQTARTRAGTATDPVTAAHLRQASRDVERYLGNPTEYAPKSSALPQPPGAPLGGR